MADTLETFEDKHDRLLQQMHARLVAVIDETCKAVAENMAAAHRSEPPPPREFFASRAMQTAYCLQCGADVEKFTGGDPKMAWHAIKNAVDIANHYWGSNFELLRARSQDT